MNYLLMLVGGGLFGWGAYNQFASKTEKKAEPVAPVAPIVSPVAEIKDPPAKPVVKLPE